MPGNVCQGVTRGKNMKSSWFVVSRRFAKAKPTYVVYDVEKASGISAAYSRLGELAQEHTVHLAAVVEVQNGTVYVRKLVRDVSADDIGEVVTHVKDMPGVQAALLGFEPGEAVQAGEQLTLADVGEAVTYELSGG